MLSHLSRKVLIAGMVVAAMGLMINQEADAHGYGRGYYGYYGHSRYSSPYRYAYRPAYASYSYGYRLRRFNSGYGRYSSYYRPSYYNSRSYYSPYRYSYYRPSYYGYSSYYHPFRYSSWAYQPSYNTSYSSVRYSSAGRYYSAPTYRTHITVARPSYSTVVPAHYYHSYQPAIHISTCGGSYGYGYAPYGY